jgi:predicted permease
MGIPILIGRGLADGDGVNDGSRAVVVNETFAKRYWPGQNPVGKRISHRYPNAPWMTVIGVARDVKHYGLDQPVIPGVYLPYVQDPQSQMAVVVRTSASPGSLVPAIRSLIRQSDPDLPIFGLVTMEERLHQSMWERRLFAALFGVFSGVALLMAVGGTYGVFSYMVNRRTQEIGLRLALGAQRRGVLWLVVRQGLLLASGGVALGFLGCLLVNPAIRNLLFGTSPFDPVTFAMVGVVLLAVAVFACWIPARRAMRIEPMTALRCD